MNPTEPGAALVQLLTDSMDQLDRIEGQAYAEGYQRGYDAGRRPLDRVTPLAADLLLAGAHRTLRTALKDRHSPYLEPWYRRELGGRALRAHIQAVRAAKAIRDAVGAP